MSFISSVQLSQVSYINNFILQDSLTSNMQFVQYRVFIDRKKAENRSYVLTLNHAGIIINLFLNKVNRDWQQKSELKIVAKNVIPLRHRVVDCDGLLESRTEGSKALFALSSPWISCTGPSAPLSTACVDCVARSAVLLTAEMKMGIRDTCQACGE